MVHFVGAGPGALDLITVRGMELLKKADVIIYAGSLVNPGLLEYAKKNAEIHNSACMTLEEICGVMIKASRAGKEVVRLHTGEPSIYGAVREQMDVLEAEGTEYDSCPGVSACFGAAAALDLEYTLPDISQTLIITRLEGRTQVPEKESMEKLASHGASMAIYLSAGMLDKLGEQLMAGGYDKDTPAAIVYKASWPEEKSIICTIGDMAVRARDEGIDRTAVVLIGKVIAKSGYERSRLYDPSFSTGYRSAGEKKE